MALLIAPVRFQSARLSLHGPLLRAGTPLGDQAGQRLFLSVWIGAGWSVP